MPVKKALAVFLIATLVLCSCALAGEARMFTNRDTDASYDADSAVWIVLNGGSATASHGDVGIEENVIRISREATYLLFGTLDDGRIVIDAPKGAKIRLILDGVYVHSDSSAPLYILQADKVVVTLAEGTENVLSNGGRFEMIDGNAIDATIFSKEDLTFNGSGDLTVVSPAGHGIAAKDDLVITGGAYRIEAAFHGMDVHDSVRITQADVTVTAGKDGIHVENDDDASLGFVFIDSGNFSITAQGDSISAGAYAQIDGGTFDIQSAQFTDLIISQAKRTSNRFAVRLFR